MKLNCTVTGTTGIISVQITGSHSAQTATAQVEAIATTLDIGSYIEIYLGYVGDTALVFTGYVKSVEIKEPTKTYYLTCADVLVKAMDYFIASNNPDAPFKRKNIKAENLVRDVLALANITNYTGDNTLFTFGINNDVEVNLTSSYDYSRFIADILAYILYADLTGKVHFTRRLPYIVGGDVPVGTLTIADATSMSYSKTDKDLRNRVVVYGAEGIFAEAKATSPYLPAGFYKTVVVAAPTVFDNTNMAQQSADYNLALLNKLTYNCNATIIGNPHLQPRTAITVVNQSLGISGNWYVFGVTHSFTSAGYTTGLDLRR